jgi:RNA ligase (TIGR02306 family)
MSTFEVPILRIDDVYDHPNADRLSILRIRGYEAIANKNPDGTHRYAKGEPIIYVPEGAVVPDRHLQERGYWKDADGKGMLAGSRGNRVKAINLRGILSQGLVWKVSAVSSFDTDLVIVGYGSLDDPMPAVGPDDIISSSTKVRIGGNVAEFFGIEKYVPVVPTSMDGRMKGVFETRFDYDIENIKAYPDLFQAGEEVVVTEKLHGTFARISYLPKMEPDEELFGDGRVAISTKGMGADGLTFIDVPANENNLYVRFLAPLAMLLQDYGDAVFPGEAIHLMGEVFGPGVQDLHYGLTDKTFRAFDVHIGGVFMDEDDKEAVFGSLEMERVPVLYKGPFDRALMDKLAAGTTTVGRKLDSEVGPNIREGVVITAAGDQAKRTDDLGRRVRPILKHVSPEYLTRKGGTEYQ